MTVGRRSQFVIRLSVFPLCSLCSLWLNDLDLIGVYRRPSAANSVLDFIRVYLRFHYCLASLGVLGGSIIIWFVLCVLRVLCG